MTTNFKEILERANKERKRVQGRRLDGSQFSGVPEIWQDRNPAKQLKEDHPDYGSRWFVGYGLVVVDEIAEIEFISA